MEVLRTFIFWMCLMLVLLIIFGGYQYIEHKRVCKLNNEEFNLYVEDNYNYNISRIVKCDILPWYNS